MDNQTWQIIVPVVVPTITGLGWLIGKTSQLVAELRAYADSARTHRSNLTIHLRLIENRLKKLEDTVNGADRPGG